jgi:hypothetical protein
MGRVMAQEVNHRPLTAEARVRARVSPRGISGRHKVALGQAFSESFGFPCQYHHSTVAHRIICADEQQASWWQQFRDMVSPHRQKIRKIITTLPCGGQD